ncbi:DNA-directed RNA polymerase subunit beta [Pasteuria penetrans]|uniref:DNA-directed RNA polymerase subunit beta n=1 Tax=Pasteuria penetrans TaxID=86005 RepID=UPI000F96E73A|nr:DNA-directed RNA polymerase subunit beta [Pasteuria penetrans]
MKGPREDDVDRDESGGGNSSEEVPQSSSSEKSPSDSLVGSGKVSFRDLERKGRRKRGQPVAGKKKRKHNEKRSKRHPSRHQEGQVGTVAQTGVKNHEQDSMASDRGVLEGDDRPRGDNPEEGSIQEGSVSHDFLGTSQADTGSDASGVSPSSGLDSPGDDRGLASDGFLSGGSTTGRTDKKTENGSLDEVPQPQAPLDRIRGKRSERLNPSPSSDSENPPSLVREGEGAVGSSEPTSSPAVGKLTWSGEEEPDSRTEVNLNLSTDGLLKNSERFKQDPFPQDASSSRSKRGASEGVRERELHQSPSSMVQPRFMRILFWTLGASVVLLVVCIMVGYVILGGEGGFLGVFDPDAWARAYNFIFG